MPKKPAKMKSSKTPFSHALEKGLAAYAAAAAAAGVGVLAMASPTSARIVFTPSNAAVDCFNTNLLIDMNGNGVADFRLSGYDFGYGHGSGRLVIKGGPGPLYASAVASLRYFGTYASALLPGAIIQSEAGLKDLSKTLTRLATGSHSRNSSGFVDWGRWPQAVAQKRQHYGQDDTDFNNTLREFPGAAQNRRGRSVRTTDESQRPRARRPRYTIGCKKAAIARGLLNPEIFKP